MTEKEMKENRLSNKVIRQGVIFIRRWRSAYANVRLL